ncbi:MAG TPA: hypothetical protein VMS81_01485, partial [Methanomicrobiales archaeon]|nr:hypothetical protein [Methanomicrobiales archaeon]
TGGWSGQGKTSGSGTSNPAQSQQNPAADVPSWIQALRDIGGMVGGVLQTAIDQLLHLLGR